jgi:hypothetical protein
MPKRKRNILVILSVAMVFSIILASVGVAYAGRVRGIGLAGVSFFLTLGIILVLGQLIPAGILLSTMIATSLSSSRKRELPVRVN